MNALRQRLWTRAINPLESGLDWTVAFEPAGSAISSAGSALADRAAAPQADVLVGLVLEERGVLRSHQRVSASEQDGADARRAPPVRRESPAVPFRRR